MTAPVSLSVRGVAAGYGGQATGSVLAGLEFDLAAGECLAVVGRSGCGKSTLLNVLAGVLAPSAGSVLAGEREVAAADWASSGVPGCRSGHAAYMFQQDLLLPWKPVLANTVFAARVAPERAADDIEGRAVRILSEFGLQASLDALPRELSGGMRQRVALARTLVLGRGLVLLDEPFGNLDAMTRAEMRLWLLHAMEAHPATWVLVTHDVAEAVLLGDRVAVLSGRPAKLRGWTDVPVERVARREVAAAEAGVGAGAGDDPDTTAETRKRLAEAGAQVRAQLAVAGETASGIPPIA